LYCHNCGYRTDDEDVFCSNCGKKLKKPREMQTKTEAQTAPAQSGEAKPPEDIAEAEAGAQNPSDTVDRVIVVPDEIIVAEESVDIMETGNAEEAGQPEEVPAEVNEEKTVPEAGAEPAEQKVQTPAAEQAFEFRPKEFETDEGAPAQSVLTQPFPDLMIADAAELKKKKSPGAVQAVCSVLLSLFLFAFSVVLISQLFIRFAFTEDRLKAAFNNVEYKEIKADGIIGLKTLAEKCGKDIPENATLAEAVYSMIDQRELVNPISLSEVEKLIDRLDFQGFLAKKSSKAVEILRSGSQEKLVDASEIIGFLKEHEEIIEKTIGIQLLEVDYKYMQKYLEENNEELLDLLSEKSITGAEDSFGYALIRFFCSDWFIAVLIVLIILIAVALGLINKRISYALFYTGAPVAAAGIVIFVCSVLYQYLLSWLSSYFPTEFIVQFAEPIVGVLTVVSAVAAVLGVILLAIGFVLKSIEKRKRIKQLAMA